jgi:hypothetical protein
MVRQAKAYLVGAVSGTALIAVAIAAFVLLVSLQVFRDWPIAALGGGKDAAVAEAEAVPGGSVAGGGSSGTAEAAAGDGGSATGGGGTGGARGEDATAAAPAPSTGTAVPAPGDGGGGGGGANGGDGGGGGAAGGGGDSGTSPAGQGTGSSTPPASSQPGGSESGSSKSGSSPSGQITEAVNNTVNQVDETVLGGALGETGVTDVTEGVVNGVAGPESTVGKVVDETVGAVGGLLEGKR